MINKIAHIADIHFRNIGFYNQQRPPSNWINRCHTTRRFYFLGKKPDGIQPSTI